MDASGAVRMDKWLWAVRLYKSRTLAAHACTGGKVRIQDQPVKSARAVRVGEVITAVTGEITRTVKVLALLDRRVGARRVPEYLEDLTPTAEYAKPREKQYRQFVFRPKGAGRPTKKQRRSIERLMATGGLSSAPSRAEGD
jgi:ribosome-associated heat shock protein Hsp15